MKTVLEVVVGAGHQLQISHVIHNTPLIHIFVGVEGGVL